MMLSFDNFTECYLNLIEQLWKNPEFESSPRGLKIKESICASFEIRNPRHRIPFVQGRDFSISYMVAELLWYLSADNSTEWISNYSSFWKNISDDGKTANSAYGARLLRRNNKIAQGRINQWEYAKNELMHDSDSRRAIMHIRVPDDSVDAKLDVPCTLALQFFIRDSKLHLVVNMRSSDVIFGLAYDVPAFTVLQEIMAMQLGIEVGSYRHISNSLHLYERHFSMAEKILRPDLMESSINTARSVGPMPNLDPFFSKPEEMEEQIQELYRLEGLIRLSMSAESIEAVVKNLAFLHDSHLSDWLKVLAAHRMKKLNLNSSTFMNLWYDGYSYGK